MRFAAMPLRVRRALRAALCALALLLPCAAHAAAPLADYKGFYVMLNPRLSNRFPEMNTALGKPFMDGALILQEWNALEKQPGQFDFCAMDRWVIAAVKAHKKISLALIAGSWTPSWVYDTVGVPKFSQHFFRAGNVSDGTNPVYDTLILPAVWDSRFITHYNQAMQAIAAHLHNLQIDGFPTGAAYTALRIVKLSGINTTTEETRLPNVPHKTVTYNSASYTQDASGPLWASFGYRPSKILAAFKAIAAATAATFPDKLLSMDIINGAQAFPEIDESGAVLADPAGGDADSMTTQLINAGLAEYRGRFAVQWDALYQSTAPSMSSGVTQAGRNGAIVAWQLNNFLGVSPTGGTGCLYPPFAIRRCDTVADFQSIITNGLDRGGKFLEFSTPTVTYPDYAAPITTTHNQLIGQTAIP